MNKRTAHAGLTLLLFLAVGWAWAEQAQTLYSVETKVWMNGEQRGAPSLLVEAGKVARIENSSGDQAWAMNVLVQPAEDAELAMQGAIWLELSIEEKVDGDWQFIADTILGLPPGQSGSISVVDVGIEIATPENASLFVEVTVQVVTDSE